MEMRRRRAIRSSDPRSTSSEPIPIADHTQSVVSFEAYVTNLVSLCITTFIGSFYDLIEWTDRMALGVSRWWSSQGGGGEEPEEAMKLLDQPSGKKKVKRRRRRDDATGKRIGKSFLGDGGCWC